MVNRIRVEEIHHVEVENSQCVEEHNKKSGHVEVYNRQDVNQLHKVDNVPEQL